MSNPLVKNKKDQKRAEAVARNLNVKPIVNHSNDYTAVAATVYPTQGQYVTVTLDKLRPYEHNPRKVRNPNFEMIKESIRRRGLDHKPNITRRPGEDFYIIADGGNTRIQALKELFSETQDPSFFSIECLFKPWKSDQADSVEAELDILIGHLIENDTRADLSFIEKALGIQQACQYYEKKLGKELSSRELSETLREDGYIIQFSMITKMQRCINFLYPYIPDVLFNGLGNSPIDKLLSIRNNALTVWEQYQFKTDIQFEEVWKQSLSRCNDDNPFNIKDFQDRLINEMADAFEDEISYEMLYLEIDLDEQKFKRLAQKQSDIEEKVSASLRDVSDYQQQLSLKKGKPSQQLTTQTPSDNHIFDEEQEETGGDYLIQETEPVNDTYEEFQHCLPDLITEDEMVEDTGNKKQSSFVDEITKGYGIVPGMSIQEHRKQQAKANGLDFALNGRQPVSDIWQVFPNRQNKAEIYSLALDIAESVKLDEFVEHIVKEPVDFSFKMKPINKELNDHQQFIYDLLDALQTDEKNLQGIALLSSEVLFQDIDDITLVKIFRLIRLVRYIYQIGGNDNV
ncbi:MULTISPECIES: ParB family protein [Pasteurellaceae]|uniref:ParB N-terminal domain-containing protein n=1 Tax=Pasteurella atlantica TaxID=2827233 RepID=A0AAW8CPL3_9PAST|nr:ParB family protein [Pasteurella atlantica]MBR0573608.1 ParB N-terminal domain-containing protein [Pasteurella atlantica]MDP8039363.1 ParB N-terminal domain-containing protein [Pasteurella atlantica]MDP8041455.1 ParB N-terminal domain-containing protein [Pasteurella atlantica]MDP8043620.1 ParB N-terminal domain-containing protein [Pasteurella atlantica]MDP8045676.1 ParB N-terminal domain-containing protein [Pasteurella atlantica]